MPNHAWTCTCDECEALRKKGGGIKKPGYTGICGTCGHMFWTPGSQGDCPKCPKPVRLTLTPDEAEQALRALNRVAVGGEEPYFQQDILMGGMTKVADAMTAAGIDHKKSGKKWGG